MSDPDPIRFLDRVLMLDPDPTQIKIGSGPWLPRWIIWVGSDPCITRSQPKKFGSDLDLVRMIGQHMRGYDKRKQILLCLGY